MVQRFPRWKVKDYMLGKVASASLMIIDIPGISDRQNLHKLEDLFTPATFYIENLVI